MTQVIKLSDNAANRIKEIMSNADNLTIKPNFNITVKVSPSALCLINVPD